MMTQLQKYTWLIETIRRAGKISHKDLSDRWQRAKDLSDCKPLHRATFNRWRDAIFSQFGIIIECQRIGGYLYYIENPEDIDEDKLKKWMLDSLAVGTLIVENLSLKDRILVNKIPSGSDHLKTILDAMRDGLVVEITYKPFKHSQGYTFPVELYCVKLHENRWYVLGKNNRDEIRLYGLDRIEEARILNENYILPKDFNASDYFAPYYGVAIENDVKPQKIVIRANENHKYYMNTLPLHESQRLIEDCGEYADFELIVAPTYDLVMKLLSFGAMIEVLEPVSFRDTMRGWVSDLYEMYKDTKNITPFEPTHPGELLMEELQCRKISQANFSQKIGVKPSLINEIIKGKRGVNTEMAMLFEAALGISAKFWINLQNEYNLQKVKSDETFMARLKEIRKITAIL